jgi:hypothetical protein
MEKYLTCKKELLGDRIFRINKKYKVIKVDAEKNCFILTDEFINDIMLIKGLWFTPHFKNKYFYSDKELRKLKLEKLNGNPNL